LVLVHQTLDSAQLLPTKPAAVRQAHGLEPELGAIVLTFDVNMPRFIPIR